MSRVISAAVSEELAERVDAAREGDGDDQESRSATVERLIRQGLDAEEPDPTALSLPNVLLWGGSVFAAAQYVDATGGLGPAGIVMMALGVLLYDPERYERAKALLSRSNGSGDSQADAESD